MNSFITYKFNLSWVKLHHPSKETLQKIVDDIRAFNPVVPMLNKKIYGHFSFSIEENLEYINVKVEIDKNQFHGNNKHRVEDESVLDEPVSSRLKDILFAMNLAYPGCIHIFSSYGYRDENILSHKFYYSTDVTSLVYIECKWITFENLTIQQCWDWITSKTNFLSYISTTPIDRALFALSYESVANDNMYIFYVMLGIESIYNDRSNKKESIMEQLRRKSQLLLGQLPQKAIKSLNKMYKMRSELVHGSTNIFKCWECDDYNENDYEKLSMERNHMITATGILLATIQKFIKNNANTLNETIEVKSE